MDEKSPQDDRNDVPSMLLPCVICNRTFRPEALVKHSKICEKSKTKKRKIFDSSRQRIQGTELAEFLPILPTITKRADKSPVRKIQQAQGSHSNLLARAKAPLSAPKTKWREKHNELVQTIKAARVPPGQPLPAPVKLSGQELCPYCERTFGPKAYDRHLEWCREQRSRIQPRSPASQRAKERLEARTKYRAPLTVKGRPQRQRSVSRDKTSMREPSPSPQPTQPRTPTTTRRKQAVMEAVSLPNPKQPLARGTPARSSSRNPPSVKRTPQPSSKRPEAYDPYKSAERQMMELLEPEREPPKLAPLTFSQSPLTSSQSPLISSQSPLTISQSPLTISQSPLHTLTSSPTSAFTKFSTAPTPEPLFISENDNINIPSKGDTKSHSSSEKSDSPLPKSMSYDNFSLSKDSNQNPINLSSLSLCSTISIESVDSNKNGYRLGISSSAKVSEKKTPVPLRRSVSASESRRSRDPLKGKLKMEDMLYGVGNTRGERYYGSPIIIGELERDDDNSSSGSMYKNTSDAETLNAEQELIKSMSEFEKLLSSSSSSPSPSSPSLKLFPSLVSSFPMDDAGKHLDSDFHANTQSGGPDSAYSSLNRKSPVGGEQQEPERDSWSVAKFCHECGCRFPTLAAKFCCHCGIRRLAI